MAVEGMTKGGSVKRVKAKQGYYAREDESIGYAFRKRKSYCSTSVKKQLAERDLSYGKWGKRSKDWKKA